MVVSASAPGLPTAMGDALQRAGLNTDEFRLRQACLDALCKHHRNVERALPTFERMVGGDEGLIREALRFYLCASARATELPGGGQSLSDTQTRRASGRQPNGDDRDHPVAASLHKRVSASPTTRDGAGLSFPGAQSGCARSAREPSEAQKAAAASVAKSIAITVLDTFRVRDGRSIGDVRFGELERMRTANAMEASVIRQIQRRFAHASHDAKVRDLVKADELNRMMQTGAEVADAS